MEEPEKSRLARVLDHSHVSELVESFQNDNYGQLVFLVGMVKGDSRPDQLHQPGAGKVEILGGNHTREALLALHHKGLVGRDIAKVNLYKELPRTAALTIGHAHNYVLHEKRQPVSFVDKVRLMRECRPSSSMTKKEIKEWKLMLTAIFKAKDTRKFSQQFYLHLLMSELPDDVWGKIVVFDAQKTVTDKFFRDLMKIKDLTCISNCLDTLLSDGIDLFKKNVKKIIAEGKVLSQKMQKKVEVTSEEREHRLLATSEETEENQEDGSQSSIDLFDDQPVDNLEDVKKELEEKKRENSSLKEECVRLTEENERLKQELASLKALNKPLKEIQNTSNSATSNQSNNTQKGVKRKGDDEFHHGDNILAKWIYDNGKEEWLDVTVKKVMSNGLVRVTFTEDRTTFDLKRSWIRKL